MLDDLSRLFAFAVAQSPVYLKSSTRPVRFLGGDFGRHDCRRAPSEDSASISVNGDQTDNSTFNAGAAYVFVRNGITWTEQAYLKAAQTAGIDDFGASIDTSGDIVVIGVPGEDGNGVQVGGDPGTDTTWIRCPPCP